MNVLGAWALVPGFACSSTEGSDTSPNASILASGSAPQPATSTPPAPTQTTGQQPTLTASGSVTPPSASNSTNLPMSSGGAAATSTGSSGSGGGLSGAAGSGGVGRGGLGGTGGAGTRSGSGGGGAGTVGGAGRSGGDDAGRPSGDDIGDAVETVEFLPSVRVNDGNNGNDVEVTISTGPEGLVLVSWVDGRAGLQCGFDVSADGGMTFGEDAIMRPESGGITGDATAAVGADGTLMAICQDYGISEIRLMTSTDAGVTWSDPRSIQGSPDKPWIGASPTEPGLAFVTWLGSSAGIIKTEDGGISWDRVYDLEFLNHGTTVDVGSEGVVHIGYSPNGGPLRYLRSPDLGDTWDAARTIAQTGSFCWSDCGSRQNPIISGGGDASGRFVAFAWAAELPEGEGDEDVWVVYSSDYGDTFTEPIRVNDNPSPSRQWQPWVTMDHAGRVHVAWTDQRNDQQDTYYARMSDPDMGFEENVKVNDESGQVSGNILDYKGIAIQGGDVLVAFPDTRNGGNDVYVAKAIGAAGR